MASSKSDEELIRLYVRKGDGRAFESLMTRYADRLFSYIIRKVSNRKDAEDIYQETWLKVARSLVNYKEEGKFSNFLFFIATNSSYDHLRRIKKDNENLYQPLDDNNDDNRNVFLENLSDHQPNPEELNIQLEEKQLVENLVATLPEKQKEVVLLRSEGFTFQEIADMTSTPLNSLLSRMRYAIEKIQSGLSVNKKTNYL